MRMAPYNLRIIGLALLALGLIATSMAFISGESEGFIMIFPFVFGSGNGRSTVALTLGALTFFAVSMFVPYYLFSRENQLARQRIYEDPHASAEFTDYIITMDVPEELRKTFFIESSLGEIRLGSRVQPLFNRSYKLPDGFEVEGYHHEFEDRFLVLRLKLKKRIA